MKKNRRKKELSNKEDMLVIANPPYGLRSLLANKITRALLPIASQVILLAPTNIYKDEDLLRKAESVQLYDNVFEDAAIQRLCVSRLTKDTNNTTHSRESLSLEPKQIELALSVKKYNETHEPFACFVRLSGNKITKYDKPLPKIATHGYCEKFRPLESTTLRQLIDDKLAFAVTVFTPQNGVHVNDAHDRTYNLKGTWDESWSDGSPVNLLIFRNSTERRNFSDWWYSCLKAQNGKKQRVGLTNAFLDLIRDVFGNGAGGYHIYFPNLDWSHPWTDEEILKELGLPSDFLEKE